jgi:hypothetical protein
MYIFDVFWVAIPLGNLTVKWTKNSSLIYLWEITKEFRGHVYDNCYSIPHQRTTAPPPVHRAPAQGDQGGIPGYPAEFTSNQVWEICMDEHPMSVSTYRKYHKIMLPENWAPLQSRSSSPISTLTNTGHNLLYPPSHVRRNGMTEHKTTEQR